MKTANEWDRELHVQAVPRLLEEKEQTWEAAFDVGAAEADFTKHLWGSRVPGSGAPERCLIAGIASMSNMGYDMTEAEKLIPKALKAREEGDTVTLSILTARVMRLVNEAKKLPGHPYWSYHYYSSFAEYAAAVRLPEAVPVNVKSGDFLRRTHAGWMAQIVGGALGTCIEGYTSEALKQTLGDITDYPRKPNTYNDDITFELALLDAFEEKGYAVTAADIAERWVGRIPMAWAAAERAIRNLRAGIYPPQCAIQSNPWREWISAQMRGAMCGMLAPGDPGRAAELAWKDGCISAVNNGILGEIFHAVMVSMAYVEKDIRTVLDKAIALIPTDSEYYQVLSFAYESCKKQGDYKQAWKECAEKLKGYNWIHAYPNAAIEVIALYFAGNDFDRCLHYVAMMGEDCDCNGAQLGTIYGCMFQMDCIDVRWRAPIGDELITYVRGYERLSIEALAERTRQAVIRAREKK